jgi:CDP-paratose 2-epimerase
VSKNILITGGAGFVGSSLAIAFKRKYPGYRVIAFDNLKRRGSEINLPRLKELQIEFIHGDIRNKEDFDSIGSPIDILIEASAEPSVLAGIQGNADYLLNTNLVGTINCLNFAVRNKSDFVFLSTSRVYSIEGLENIKTKESSSRLEIAADQLMPGISASGISEQFPVDGYRSFYGTSKLSSELIIAEYNHFYKLRTVINRCGILTGPWQMGKVDQGVVVLWMAKHFWKKSLQYIGYGGKGLQVRDMLHVNDLFALLDLQLGDFDAVNGQTFNVGGGNDVNFSLQELTRLCAEITGNVIPVTPHATSRQADIPVYITDWRKVNSVTKWQPATGSKEIITDIFEWLKSHERSLRDILA